MPDPSFRNQDFIFKSRGVVARNVDDTLDPGQYLNMNNCEELAENSIANRLGTSLVNRTGNAINQLSSQVHSLAKLSSLNGASYRYAGAGGNLYRRSGLTPGAYTQIATGLSGKPWQSQPYTSTNFTSTPYLFIADGKAMLKDNGTFTAPQQMGIFQPQFPVQAQVQPPFYFGLEPFGGTGGGATYTNSGITGFLTNQVAQPNTTLTSAVAFTGIQTVSVAAVPNPIQVNQFVKVGSEFVFVISVTKTGFTGLFSTTHPVGTAVQGLGISGTVNPSSSGIVTCTFPLKLSAIGAPAFQQADYISLQLALTGSKNVQQILLEFDCGNGSFQDYFYKVIGQGALQSLLNTTASPETSATDSAITDTLGIYGNAPGSLAQLNPGDPSTTSLMIQLSDFAGAGKADFNDPVFNWQNVGAYRVIIVTTSGGTVAFQLYCMEIMGLWGPDTFAGVGYDYLFTFFNAVDGTESNPCMPMSNVSPPLNTKWVYPRRSPVRLTLNLATNRPPGLQTQDTQITHIRIYRRGGTLGDNYRRIYELPVNISAGGTVVYVDGSSDVDIQNNDIVSFENDVPVTSSLPVPVNTQLSAAALASVFPATSTIPLSSIANVSVGQQLSLGTPGSLANNFETVVVLGIAGSNAFAFVQNAHAVGEPVTATAMYGQPMTIMTEAFGQMWFAGDTNNPHYLYWSARNYPQAVSSAAYVAVGSPDDPITAIVQFKGNLYVSTQKFWWAVAPGSTAGGSPTVYPTATKHGCVAPNGYTVTEDAVYYQSIDGIRAFAGGQSAYLTQEQEFIWQGVGSSPIPGANLTALNQTKMAYWNNMIFVAYFGANQGWWRMIYHTVYKRWRNDDRQASAILLEADTNTLVYGDIAGLIHVDRLNQPYDEANIAGALGQQPIQMALQSSYMDQGEPAITKNYQELTLDVNTNGQTLNVTLLFEDGQQSFLIGTVNTTQRKKVNFILNGGLGYEFYKVSLKLDGQVSLFTYIYQCSLKSLPLAKTRLNFDTYKLRFSDDASKIAKQLYMEYTSTADIACQCYYDDAAAPGYTFTLPNSNGVRVPLRVRLPAVSFRIFRLAGQSTANFQIWEDSRAEVKSLCQGKGYELMPFVPNG